MSNAKAGPPRGVAPVVGSGRDTVKSSGRTTFDSRGNAVWEWQTEEGDFSTDVSTQRLKKLEATELSLEETGRLKKVDRKDAKPGALPGGGFNPYDRGTSHKDTAQGAGPKASGSANSQSSGQSIQSKVASQARKPVKDLKRLQEWMDMKTRLANKKDED